MFKYRTESINNFCLDLSMFLSAPFRCFVFNQSELLSEKKLPLRLTILHFFTFFVYQSKPSIVCCAKSSSSLPTKALLSFYACSLLLSIMHCRSIRNFNVSSANLRSLELLQSGLFKFTLAPNVTVKCPSAQNKNNHLQK